ncbi:HIRAN domain-containing protein [Flavobacterium sp.]|uniref:HIRAN domain-containing protein n=1 Tax=Flavobacterium sp. TaxID=239 RepID=UPI00286E77EA|nr:HIRAN domain-containing protein [Flavobacterium sp.]
MGKSTSIFANHNLDTASLEKLAKDIAARLCVSVEYGYQDFFNYEKFQENPDYDYDNVILGTLNCPDSKKKYTLIDTKYQYKTFIEKYGVLELEKPYFADDDYRKQEILEAQNAVEYELEEDYDILITIYRDTMDLWLVNSLDWRYFQRFFLYKQDEGNLKYIENWRIKNRDWIYKLGGDYMFVGCYEDKSAFLFDEAVYKTSQEIKTLVADKFSEELVNIPNYIKAKLFFNKPEYIQKPIERNFFRKLDYFKNNDINYNLKDVNYSSIYYDDFHDLENSKLIEKEFDVLNDGLEVVEQEIINERYRNSILIKNDVLEIKIPEKSFLIYEGFISGLQYYSFYHIDMTMKINQELRLQLEPNNKFDTNAIIVAIEDEVQEKKLGYIAQQDNIVLSKLLQNNQKLRCYLQYINEKEVENINLNKAVKIAIYFEK